MRHGRVRLTLDVPPDEVLLSWAAAAFKPLAGQVVLRDGKDGPALETLAWEAGHCVGYREEFVSGDTNAGAYVCHLTIAAPQLTMKPGGPGIYTAPAAGPQQAYLGAPLAVTAAAAAATAATAVETFVAPTFEQIAAAGLSALGRTALATAAAAALPAALTVGFVLMPTNSRDDPGYAAEWDLYRRNHRHLTPVTPDLLRLAQLEQLHAQGDLTPEEEKELIALLGKVKGIHVQKLSDLKQPGLVNAPALPIQTISNKFPNEAMPSDGKIVSYHIVDGNIKGVNGRKQFDFIVDKEGKLILGNKHHTLGRGGPVQAAGQLRLNGQGQIRQIDNLSGHYQPTVSETANYPRILGNAGVKVKGATIVNHSISTNPSGMVTGVKIVSSTVIK